MSIRSSIQSIQAAQAPTPPRTGARRACISSHIAGFLLLLSLLAGRSPAGDPAPESTASKEPGSGTRAAARDLTGHRVAPLAQSRGRIVVLVFIRRDCPISNRYAPTLRVLHEKFTEQDVDFYLAYPNPATTAEAIQHHLQEYKYDIPALRDPRHALVGVAKARVTPEAAVFNRKGKLVYHGRIDDRYVDFGKTRAQPTTHDLEAAIEATLADKPVTNPVTEAVGCYISDLQ